jgi:Short C-terminal domain
MAILRRRPVLRAAAIVGGAYRGGERRREAGEHTYEEQPRGAGIKAAQSTPLPASALGGMSEAAMRRLEQLYELRERGALTDDEFAKQKTALLGE